MIFLICLLVYVIFFLLDLCLIRQLAVENAFDDLNDFIIAMIIVFIPIGNIIGTFVQISKLKFYQKIKNYTKKEINQYIRRLFGIDD